MTNVQIGAAIVFGGPFLVAAVVTLPAAFSVRYKRLLRRHLIN